jgi:SNF2 family DNA or RNA helicase
VASIVQWDEIKHDFLGWDEERQGRNLFLENHPEYPAYLLVNSFDPLFTHTLRDTIGEYRAIHKLKFEKLVEAADEAGYEHLIYTRPPSELFDFLEKLDEPFPTDLNVDLKKFQIRGYNFLRSQDSKFYNWSTGTGKSVIACAETKHLLETGQIDKVIVLSKSHNKINWQRQFKKIVGLDAVTDQVTGNVSTRREKRSELYQSEQIIIINYEKLRFRPEGEEAKYDVMGRKRPSASGDGQELAAALKGKRVLWIMDEMTNKMKSMSTGWYKGMVKLKRVTKQNRFMELTARKIDRDPENIYACMKIIAPGTWNSIATFRQQYAKSMSTFSPWRVASWDQKKLPELGMRLSHMTHIADKYTDPEIRAEFPEDHWEDIWVDMSDEDRKLYQLVEEGVLAGLGDVPTISKIVPLMLVCNNPLMLAQSESKVAKAIVEKMKVTDKHCAKLETLQEMLDEIEGKVVIFSMFNDLGSKMLAPYLAKWGHSYVLYDGNPKKMQEAQDRFRQDKRVKIFLSSDKGSDSIDLEQATTVINYDLPWNYSTLIQRVNRISRLTSDAEHVFYYNLVTAANTVEERKLKFAGT